ncbi:MAG TPA: XRE family transcriptional regulator [Allosphingosinicella sp.]|jgi:Zn-dependent peptidase ImmA (M78 family)/DNA-binding XRE family transcriptional regulator|nr:XRE family transcriptional regulator [Allosphingosinicella sp.]
MFNGDKLALARRRKGLTKIALAKAVNVTPRALSAYEAGEYPPSDETCARLAEVLRFPVAFFWGESLEEFEERGVSFRSMKRMTAAQKHSALAAGSFAYEINKWIDQRFQLPLPDVPDLSGEDPEVAARILRSEWALGQYSIRNMVHLVESKGVRVYSLFENAKEIDAFSIWKDGTPFIFSNRLKSSAHRRFDIGHELGHLVLHRRGAPSGPEAERQADMFAAAFLMPSDAVKAASTGFETVTDLIKLKKKWMVSVGAIARRLKDTGMVSDWGYRSLCIEISQRGYRTKEPNDYPPEKSMVWEKIMASLRSTGDGVHAISRDLSIPTEEVEKLVWGLVTIGLSAVAGPVWSSSKKGHLRLVE